MKKFSFPLILFILVNIIFFTSTLQAQKKDNLLSSKLIPGCPKEIEFVKDQLHLSDLSYTYLATGIDSIDIMFGELNQQGHKGYWISLLAHKELKFFSTSDLLQQAGSAFPSNIINLKFDESSRRISVQIAHNTSTNEIEYSWLNNNQKSQVATIENLDQPIQRNKVFPSITVNSLDGKAISMQDYKGKYVVINWWATTCGPCRQEIPGLNTLVEKYKSNTDVVFLAIAFNKPNDLKDYLKNNEFKYLQTTGDAEVAKLLGEAFPQNMIVNPQGMITYFSVGGHEKKYLNIEDELIKQMNHK